MRRACILVILAVFVLYCIAAQRRRNLYRLPHYREVRLSICGGATPAQWASPDYAAQRYQRLSDLEKRRLQLLEPVPAPVGAAVDPIKSAQPLTREHYERLVSENRLEITVRDPAALYRFADRGLRLREDVSAARGSDVPQRLGTAGEPVSKALLDRCLRAGLTHVRVVGAGDVVGFNGTVFMVVLIFVGMTLALTEIFWDPMLALVDQRRAAISAGRQARRSNAQVAKQIDTEQREQRQTMRDAYRERLSEARLTALKETEAINRRTREHLKRLREEGNADLHTSVHRARQVLSSDVAELADALVAGVVASPDGETREC